jgi:Mg-chelatase subunit ChlD/type II secretory pathway pseudopilin PulG
MNPEHTNNPREELELKVTALLLGELNDAEAAAVREAISQDAELQKLHDDLKQTIHLVREATVTVGAPEIEPAEPLKLSETRRKVLRVAFTIPPLKLEHIQRKPRPARRLIELLVVVAIIGILASLSLPSLSKAKSKSQRITVLNNMRQLELAKQMWADENQKPAGAAPTMEDLRPYWGGKDGPRSVGGEHYVPGKVGEPAMAVVDADDAKRTLGRLPTKPADSDADTRIVVMSSDGKLGYANNDQMAWQFSQGNGRLPRNYAKVPAQLLDVAGTVVSGKQPATPLPTAIVLPNTTSLETEGASLGLFAFESNNDNSTRPVSTSGSKPAEDSAPWNRNLHDDAYAAVPAQNQGKPPTQPLADKSETVQLRYQLAGDIASALDSLSDGRDRVRVDSVNNTITLSAGDQEGAELLAKLDTQSKQQLIGGVEERASSRRGGQGGGGFSGGGGGGANGTWGSYDGAAPGAAPRVFSTGSELKDVEATVVAGNEIVTVDGKQYQKEFLGYDDPGAFIPQAQTGSAGVPITAQMPQPRYRLKAVENSSETTPGQAGAGEWFKRANGHEVTKSESAPTGRPVELALEESLRRQSDEEGKFGSATDGLALDAKSADYWGVQAGGAAVDRALGEKSSVPALGDGPFVGHLFRSGESAPATTAPSARPEVASTVDSVSGAQGASGPDYYFGGSVVNGGTLGLDATDSSRLSALAKENDNSDSRATGFEWQLGNVVVTDTISSDAFVEADRKSDAHNATGQPAADTFRGPLRGMNSLAASDIPQDQNGDKAAFQFAVGKEFDFGPNEVRDSSRLENRSELKREIALKGVGVETEEAMETQPAPEVNIKAKFKEAGEAEWTGVLEQPSAPKENKDHFVSRYALLSAPGSGPEGRRGVDSNIVLPSAEAEVPSIASDQLLTSGLRDNAKREPNLALLDTEPARDRSRSSISDPAAVQRTLDELYSDPNGRAQFPEVAGIAGTASTKPKRGTAAVESELTSSDEKRTSKVTDQDYWAKKRELDKLLAFQKLIETRVTMESVDRDFPQSGHVTILDRAVPESNAGLLGGIGHALGKDYQATTRIKLDRGGDGIQEFGNSRTSGVYDPYFVQTEFETMKSDAVLTNVAAKLGLDKEWAKQNGGRDLAPAQVVEKLRKSLELKPVPNTTFVSIKAKSSDPKEAADIANAVADAYKAHRLSEIQSVSEAGVKALRTQFEEQQAKIDKVNRELADLRVKANISDAQAAGVRPQVEPDVPLPRKASTNAPIPQPEIQTSENTFSTFSLNVSDVSFKLAAASLEKGQMPDVASLRSEEFINAFDYRDPEPSVPLLGGDRGGSAPIAFAWERARYPFAHNRDLLRFSLKTAAAGRQAGRPLNVVVLLDNSGSMERADRVQIIREALRVLASQLQPQDKLSVITFARTPRLIADGVSGDRAGEVAAQVGGLTPEGGTNLEDAMNLAYQTAAKHYLAKGINRVVVLTDGAANLGDVEPESLKRNVEAQRKQGIALDCFGIGWDGFNDDLLEVLSRNGDGRYGFINSPAEAATDFVGQLAGALKVAASDVKVQVEFNAARVTAYRQIGYAKHQLKKEQFRDNTVDAAEIAAQEAGNALYTVEVNPDGSGPLATVRVRYKVPGTAEYREQAWDVPYAGSAVALDQASPAMRLAATASAFSEWLVVSPYAGEVTPDALLGTLNGVPEVFGADPRPKKLEWMIRQAKSLSGK